jgi:MoaA/NifB/PqqE/SkfB family radical SAM enzyme
MSRLQQHVVEGKRVCAGCRFNDACHGQIPSFNKNATLSGNESSAPAVCMGCLEVGEGW